MAEEGVVLVREMIPLRLGVNDPAHDGSKDWFVPFVQFRTQSSVPFLVVIRAFRVLDHHRSTINDAGSYESLNLVLERPTVLNANQNLFRVHS